MRTGIPAIQVTSAASKAFWRRIAASKRAARRRAAVSRRVPVYGITLSIAVSRAYRSATQGFARIAMCACGKMSRMARSAGRDMTASPIQLVARTQILDTDEGLKGTCLQDNSGGRSAISRGDEVQSHISQAVLARRRPGR